MRQHARRNTEISLRYYGYGISAHVTGQMRNVSLGGLSFKSQYHFQTGTQLIVHIPYLNPTYRSPASVVWCHHSDSFYEVGVKFHETADDMHKIMFEQVCLIEDYKSDVKKIEGRGITSEQAAREWISLMGEEIPC